MNITPPAASKAPPLLLLILLSMIGALSVDIYLPSMPAMATFFHTSPDLVQLTMSVYIAGFGFSQFIFGPLLDRFGRRPVLLLGLLIFLFATLLCALAPSIQLLILARFLQAIGACSASVATYAIVRDVSTGKKSALLFSYILTAVGLSPSLAPTFGGYIQTWFEWRVNFLVLFAMGVGLIITVYFSLAETCPKLNKNAIQPRSILKNIRALVKNKLFIYSGIANACAFSSLVAFVTSSPFLYIEQLKIEPIHFGYLFAVNAFALICSGFLNSRLLRIAELDTILKLGRFIMLLGAVCLFGMALFFKLSVLSVLIPMLVVSLGIGLILPNTVSKAMEGFPEIAGTASALMGSLRFGLAAIISATISFAHTHNAIFLGGALLACAVVNFICLHMMTRERKTVVT